MHRASSTGDAKAGLNASSMHNLKDFGSVEVKINDASNFQIPSVRLSFHKPTKTIQVVAD